ncbi:epoxide hydrolase family protein [Salinispora arenicola]|uniref:epoxide hydrolase family protein n=1 Tax=Salinispora arenicola TaxID=168697 RepID=UPI0003652FE1|nr:epoxide hydrolase family protein [Salinispora arenicola]
MRPYRVEIPAEAIDDLRARLAQTRWPAETPDVGWSRGVPQTYLRDLVEYWRTEYDWRATEARINQYPQFMTNVDGANIHFLHVRSPEPDAVPMVITTGWPSSIIEYLDVIGPLTDPRAHGGDPKDAFHLVIPSLPGFGFSTPLTEHGWTVPRMSAVWAKFMAAVGYDRYIAQGADWGSFISLILAGVDPDHVLAAHVNFLVTPPTDASDLAGLSSEELALLDPYMLPAPGYMVEHATKPQTLSYSLTDSPVGQLAWYIEKFHQWSGADKSPEDVFDRDALLANVTLYWLTGTAGSAAHFYCDNAPFTRTSATPHPELAVAHEKFEAHRTFVAPLPPVTRPVGVALYPDDIMMPIRSYAERAFTDIVHWNKLERGGHFPALEAPDLFVEDLRAFRRALRTRQES